MKKNAFIILFILFISSLHFSYAGQISARNIIEGRLDHEATISEVVQYDGIEASLLVYDELGNSSLHQLDNPLYSKQKFKIRLKSTVDGVLQILAKNSDGSQQELPLITIKRGIEEHYPKEKLAVLTLDEQKGQEELILILVPQQNGHKLPIKKNILEGILNEEAIVTEEATTQASYLAAPINKPIIKRMILTHQ